MAWLQSAFEARSRAEVRNIEIGFSGLPRASMNYGLSVAGGTLDMDYTADDYNVSLVRITAVEREGKVQLEIKRFAGPRGEAYDAANEWRESLE